MYYLYRISSPLSESWFFLTYAILLAFMFASLRLNPNILKVSFSTLFSSKERNSIFYIGSSDIRADLFLTLFCIGLFPLNIYLGLYSNSEFLFLNMLKVALLFISVMVAKYLATRLLFYVFFNNALFQIAIQHYYRIIVAVATILAPATIFAVFFITIAPIAVYCTYGLIALFYLISLLIKIFRLFFTKTLASLYIFLYLCILEFIPALIIILGSKMLVS